VSKEKQARTTDRGKAETTPRGRRLKWLLLTLLALMLVALWQRERFASISDHLAHRALARRDLPAAREWLQISKRISADAPQTEFLLGRLCRREGRMEEARQHLLRAKHLGYDEKLVQREEWLALAQTGQMQVAEKFLAELLRDPQGDGPEICEAFVIGYLRNREFQSALSLIGPWAQDYPRDAQPLYWAGLIHREQLDVEQAEHDLRDALQRDAGHTAAALALAEILLEAKRADEAVAFFRQAREDQDPARFVAASLGLARCLRAAGETQAAARILGEAEAVDHENVDVQVELANIEIGESKYEDVEQRLRPLLADNMQDRVLRFAYATALRGIGKTQEAEPHFQYASEAAAKITRANELKVEVLKNRPKDADLRFEIGQTYLTCGLPEEGLMWLFTVLEIDPRHQPTHRLLADYYAAKIDEDPRFAALAQRHQAMLRGDPSTDNVEAVPDNRQPSGSADGPAGNGPKKEHPIPDRPG
jgi:predicted Zn-dependent protease